MMYSRRKKAAAAGQSLLHFFLSSCFMKEAANTRLLAVNRILLIFRQFITASLEIFRE